MEELEYLEIRCNTMNDLLMKSMESRFMSKKRNDIVNISLHFFLKDV